MTRLINNFLTFSQLERNKQRLNFEVVAVEQIVEGAVEAVKTQFDKQGCELEVELAEGLGEVRVDFDRMVVVLVNLLDNGCKYGKEADKWVGLKVFREDVMVCFAVSDNGIGLPKRAGRKVFERFYQVDRRLMRQGEGVGLGLSIVKFIVEAHEGAIEVESEVGRGSLFRVKIPVERKG
ncbi:MAG: HAMP domain-containing histidine kinase [Planctomycetes bacterium]|nr:HAMP domain-containing histidine kinase [Planctomycetota bacterium]